MSEWNVRISAVMVYAVDREFFSNSETIKIDQKNREYLNVWLVDFYWRLKNVTWFKSRDLNWILELPIHEPSRNRTCFVTGREVFWNYFMIKILIYSCYSVWIFEKCFSSKNIKMDQNGFNHLENSQIFQIFVFTGNFLVLTPWLMMFENMVSLRITRDKSTRTDIIRYKLVIIRFQLVFRCFSRLVQKLFRNSSEFQSFFVHESFKRATLCHLIVRRNHTRK